MIKKWIWGLSLLALYSSAPHLQAFEFHTQHYPKGQVPKDQEEASLGDAITLVTLQKWPTKNLIQVHEFRPASGNPPKFLVSVDADQVFMVGALGYFPGEPVTFEFKDSKTGFARKLDLVPKPICVKSSMDNAQIEAVFVQLKPSTYTLKLKNFDPKEELLFESSSGSESMKRVVSCSQQTVMMYMPGVVSQVGGTAHVKFTRASGECLKLDIDWGMEILKYNLIWNDEGVMCRTVDQEEFLKKNKEAAHYFHPERFTTPSRKRLSRRLCVAPFMLNSKVNR